MHRILNQQLSVLFKDAFRSLVCFKLNTYFFIFQLRLLAITEGASHYSGVVISCYQMVIIKDSSRREAQVMIFIIISVGMWPYINRGGGRWRILEVWEERGVTCWTVVEISTFEGNFSFRGVWRPACMKRWRRLCLALPVFLFVILYLTTE